MPLSTAGAIERLPRLLLTGVALVCASAALFVLAWLKPGLLGQYVRLETVAGTIFVVGVVTAAESSGGLFDAEALRVRWSERTTRWGLIGLAALGSGLVATAVLRGFPNSADEVVYLYQAACLAAGQATGAVPSAHEFFETAHLIARPDLFAGRFPVGWPAMLAPFVALGIAPWFATVIYSAAGVGFLHAYATRRYGNEIALAAVLAVVVTPFYLFNAGSLFSHGPMFMLIALAAWSIERSRGAASFGKGALVGFALGMAVLTRPLTALILGGMLAGELLLTDKSARRPAYLLGIVCGGLPTAAALLGYNVAVTGDPFLLPTRLFDPEESLGFHHGHTPLTAARDIVRHLAHLATWASPLMLVMWVVLAWQRLRNRPGEKTPFEFWVLVPIAAAYALYYNPGGNRYGPRFYFEALPLMSVGLAAAWFQSRSLPFSPAVRRQVWAAVLCVSALQLPMHAWIEGSIVRERMDLADQVERQQLRNAVVIVSSGTSIMRPMVPEDLVRNSPSHDDDVLFALDLGAKNAELLAAYPDRDFYQYVRPEGRVRGQLRRLRPDAD